MQRLVVTKDKNDMERRINLSTWMVVEDEPDIYEVLLAMFEIWGIEGVAFIDGEEAVAWIDDVDNGRFQGELPELALLDIRLPGDIDGVGVGQRLRKSPVLCKMSIVLTTAYQLNPEEQDEAIKLTKADRWVSKPLPKFKELKEILEDVITKRREKTRNSDNQKK
jgi:CheY-like chemotaxis protein